MKVNILSDNLTLRKRHSQQSNGLSFEIIVTEPVVNSNSKPALTQLINLHSPDYGYVTRFSVFEHTVGLLKTWLIRS